MLYHLHQALQSLDFFGSQWLRPVTSGCLADAVISTNQVIEKKDAIKYTVDDIIAFEHIHASGWIAITSP